MYFLQYLNEIFVSNVIVKYDKPALVFSYVSEILYTTVKPSFCNYLLDHIS